MEKLIVIVLLTIPVGAIIAGFIGGAIGNLFGLGFWQPAAFVGAAVGMFLAGGVFLAR
jgi:hypothetical protein